jgi:hypothetical protein
VRRRLLSILTAKNRLLHKADSLLEGDGFELSVPREMGTVSSLRFVTFLEIPMDSDVMTVVLQIRAAIRVSEISSLIRRSVNCPNGS